MRMKKPLLLVKWWINLIKCNKCMNKNHTKEHIIYDSIYINLKTRQNSPMEIETVWWFLSLGGRRLEGDLLGCWLYSISQSEFWLFDLWKFFELSNYDLCTFLFVTLYWKTFKSAITCRHTEKILKILGNKNLLSR